MEAALNTVNWRLKMSELNAFLNLALAVSNIIIAWTMCYITVDEWWRNRKKDLESPIEK